MPEVDSEQGRDPAGQDASVPLDIVTRAADLGVWDWDLINQSFVYSPKARQICGFTLDQEVTLDDVRRVTHPQDLQRTWAMAQQALDPDVRASPRFEYRLVRPDGVERWVAAVGEAVFANVDGAVKAVRYIGTLQDITEQRRLAGSERDANARLRLAIDAGGMAVWDYDVAARTVNGSIELNRLLGFPDEARPSPEDIEAGYMPGERERLRAIAQTVLERGAGSIEAEYRYRRPDGGLRWLMLRANVEFDEMRQPAKLVGELMDVTDRKAGETALIESRARFQAIADSAPSPLWITTPDGDIEFVNEAFAEHAGLPKDAVLGNVWQNLVHPDDLPGVASRRAVAREVLAPYEFEARFRTLAGDYRNMLAHSKPRFDGDGAFEGYVGMAVDVTDMRRAEEALRESEARFRLMAEDSPVMMWLGDEAGACLYLNRALRDFWGVPEDLAGFTWASTLLDEDREGLFAAFGAAMAKQEAFEVDARYHRADGAVRWLTTRAQPRRDAAGRFLGMIGVNIDDTDYREAQTRQRLLINELNHRVKNTLASVQSIVRQSLREGMTASQAREVLIERLMALSSAHNILTQRNWEGAALREVVAEALRPFDDARESRFEIGGDDVQLAPTTALAVSMALHELGTNAVKYGALSVAAGRVSLNWTLAPGRDAVRLEWRERSGPPVKAPSHAGFGTRLLQSGLASNLGEKANLDFDPAGLAATFDIRTLAVA